MKDIVGAEKLIYEDFIDIQIQTGGDYRGSFMFCYYYIPMGFKGEVETFSKDRICFKRIYADGMYPDGTCFEGKEDHERAILLEVLQYEVTEVKERLHSTHYEEVKTTIEDALTKGVEFYKIELDFKPDGVSLYKVYKTKY